jgi:iodotyrosine deiodinase
LQRFGQRKGRRSKCQNKEVILSLLLNLNGFRPKNNSRGRTNLNCACARVAPCGHFSPRRVPRELIETALRIASRAPSGANQQPWRFVVVLDPEIKRKIRIAAEAEERDNYERRFPHEWLEALAALGTDWHKDFLEIAPCLNAVSRLDYGIAPEREEKQRKIKHYYVQESVGIACGFLMVALHWMGLATLTHTPSPMGFLSQVLQRPANEKPYLLLPIGFPADDAEVPDISKKPLSETAVFLV